MLLGDDQRTHYCKFVDLLLLSSDLVPIRGPHFRSLPPLLLLLILIIPLLPFLALFCTSVLTPFPFLSLRAMCACVRALLNEWAWASSPHTSNFSVFSAPENVIIAVPLSAHNPLLHHPPSISFQSPFLGHFLQPSSPPLLALLVLDSDIKAGGCFLCPSFPSFIQGFQVFGVDSLYKVYHRFLV